MASTEIPMRWSDLDTLRHVNNVVYVDYALEVWPELRSGGLIPHEDPRRVEVDYRRPVLKSDNPIHIDTAIDGLTLTQGIFVTGAEHPAAIVTSRFDGDIESARVESSVPTGRLMLRYSDLDDRRQINTARLFELFQEARVLYMNTTMREARIASIVIARSDVRVIKPIRWQTEPMETQTWVKTVGGSSFAIRAQLCKDGVVHAVAETVMVAFDAETQRSAKLTEDQRERLRALMLD